MIKVITFLGVRPSCTDYSFSGKVYSGRVFAEALRQFIHFDQMLVCTTAEARREAWPVLEALSDPRIVEVPIPRGESTGEMWDIFACILEHIEQGDRVIFDITHGLRSLPFLVFLFAAYLKSAKNVALEAIYYGALELQKKEEKRPAPVIDMTEFVEMLEWLAATDQFTQTGDARRLAGLLNPSGKQNGVAAKASRDLSEISQAALLCQPFTLMKNVPNLANSLAKAQQELDLTAWPFAVLRDQIIAAFQPLAGNPADLQSVLAAELNMIEWYFNNRQLIQAMSLAREWLIDAVTARLGLDFDLKAEMRALVERAISGLALIGRPFFDNQIGERRIFTIGDLNQYGRLINDSWPEKDQLVALWNILSPLRNTLDHAEHQASPVSMKTIAKRAAEARPLIHELAAILQVRLAETT